MRGRIRTIKPEALLDEELWDLEQELQAPVFRAFVGLWTQADREGRFEWRPRALKAAVLPYWEGDFSRVLDALATRGFLVRYAVQGREYGCVRTFKRHQVINNREQESELPEPPPNSPVPPTAGLEIPDTSTRDSRVLDASVTPLVHAPVEGKGREGKGTGRELSCDDADASRGRAERAAVVNEQSPAARTWAAYALAYRCRYECEPTRNAKVNAQIKQLVSRVPAEDAPGIAGHYVRSNNARYVAAGHSVGLLVQDAEKLRTEYLTGRSVTAHEARTADRTSGRAQQYQQAFAQLRAEDQEASRG